MQEFQLQGSLLQLAQYHFYLRYAKFLCSACHPSLVLTHNILCLQHPILTKVLVYCILPFSYISHSQHLPMVCVLPFYLFVYTHLHDHILIFNVICLNTQNFTKFTQWLFYLIRKYCSIWILHNFNKDIITIMSLNITISIKNFFIFECEMEYLLSNVGISFVINHKETLFRFSLFVYFY